MIAVKVICLIYVVFLVLARMVNYKECSKGANYVRLIDNIMILVMLMILSSPL